MTAILQISDTHIVPEGDLVSGRVDSADILARLVGRIGEIRDQVGGIDAVLVTGDVSDDGSAESYARFKALMAPLGAPLLVIPGNHDARAPFRAAFADGLPGAGALNWSRRVGEITVIGLDTLVEGSGFGTLTDETLAFLRAELGRLQGAPCLLALHHPPFSCGIAFMDRIGLTNRDAFIETLQGHDGEVRIVCGHIHTMMVADIAGHIALSAPSPCTAFAFDSRPETPAGFWAQEDGCLLHRWDSGFQSIRIGPVAGPGPFPF